VTSYRVLIVALDGATFDLIDPLLARGRMPTLARLAAQGVRAPLRSTTPPVSAPAWVTFLTGQQPGKHGVFGFQNLDSRGYAGFSETLVNSSYFSGRTLLDHLAAVSSTRTLAYRVPMTYPAWEVPNGVVVSGPPVPDRRRAYARPTSVEAEVGPISSLSHEELEAAKAGRDTAAIDACNRFELGLLETTTTRYLDAGYELAIAFTGIADGLQHPFWGLRDPSSPIFEPDAPAALRTIIERWYEEIDAVIGRLVARCPADTAVIVVSDHGGGPAPTRHVNLNAALRAGGFLDVLGGGRATVAGGVRSLVDHAHHRMGSAWLKRNLPVRLRRRLRELRSATAAIAWERTHAFAIPIYYPVSGVWVNLVGRHPRGTVAPGADYEQVRERLTTFLRELRDPESGRLLVTGVWRREDVYTGPHASDAPDLIVETAPGHHGGFGLDRLVTDVPAATLRKVSGSHTKEGIFIGAGGPFRAGVAIEPPHLADVLPTALHLLGAPLPKALDGQVVANALDAAFMRECPVRFHAPGPYADGDVTPTTLPSDDEGEIWKSLQGLGYGE
jgi:predicted AlkP superfamily phosphohydrolase/phosphomutase